MKITLIIVTAVVGLTFALSASACSKHGKEGNQATVHEEKDDHSGHQHGKSKSETSAVKNGFDKMPPVGTKAKCPVMGNEFEVKKDSLSSVYKGKTYLFCCPACKPKFDADPKKYVKTKK
jgi:YHS domain-containing protein